MFVKGKSGNPSGQSKAAQEVKALAAKMCPQALAKIYKLMNESRSDTLQFQCAVKILEFGIGRPAQQFEFSGPGGFPIAVRHDDTDLLERLRKVALIGNTSHDGKGMHGGTKSKGTT